MPQEFFNQSEADEILRLAVKVQTDGMNREQLYSTAAELGIDANGVDAAIAQRAAERERQEAKAQQAAFHKEARKKMLLYSVLAVTLLAAFFVLLRSPEGEELIRIPFALLFVLAFSARRAFGPRRRSRLGPF